MRVPPTLSAQGRHGRFTDERARPLQSNPPMPRKQRFKPSRKPQNTQQQAANQHVDDRKDIIPEQQREIQRDTPVITGDPEVE